MNDDVRILLVEDVAGDAELVQAELRRAGLKFCAKCVETREAFLRELTAFAPDLVISGYKLPQFNGTAAVQLVNEIAPDIPVIIVTAPINERTAVECMRAGAADYVVKDDLLGMGPAVERALARKREQEEKRQAEDALRRLNLILEQRVANRTAELEAARKEFESFTHSVSHDLRGPLRSIDGFSSMLHEDYVDRLDAEGRRRLDVIRNSAAQMQQLIDGLLALSRTGRARIEPRLIDTGRLVESVLEEIRSETAERQLELRLGSLPPIHGDRTLIRQVFANLLSNAVKFTGSRDTAIIELGCRSEGDEDTYYVKDNGAGFDMAYVDKLFGLFQRLHYADEFPGTGVGLAIVQRIIQRHGGRVWAEGKVDEGATFYFALPRQPAPVELSHA